MGMIKRMWRWVVLRFQAWRLRRANKKLAASYKKGLRMTAEAGVHLQEDVGMMTHQLVTALQAILRETEDHIEAHLKQVPGEAVPTYEGDPEWVVLEDIRDIVQAALGDHRTA